MRWIATQADLASESARANLLTFHEIKADNCFGRAAECAFFLALSIFPILICVLSFLSFLPNSEQLLMNYLARLLPHEGLRVISTWMEDLVDSRKTGIFSFGLVSALLGGSSGMTALMDMLNAAYNLKEGRSFLKARLLAICMMIVLGMMILGGAAAVILGDNVIAWIARHFGLDEYREVFWNVVTNLAGLLMLLMGITFVYHYGPNIRQKPRWFSAGSIFAVLASLAASFVLSLYVKVMPSMDLTYGSLGAFMVLMLWLYVMSLILMIGAEIDSEIERAAGRAVTPAELPE